MIGLFALPAEAKKAIPITPLCPNLVLRGEIDPGFSDVEKRLLCGDPHPEAANTDQVKFDDAWKRIPNNQARMNLKNFLQQRGYLNPKFSSEIVTVPGGEEINRIFVDVGEPTRVTRLFAVGAPDELRISRKRKVIGEILTPKLLGQVEAWVESRLKALGYPCPKVKSEADPQTGEVKVNVTTGPLQNLEKIVEKDIPGLQPEVMRRYDAFRIGDLFNGDWLAVSENRIQNLSILESIHYIASCGDTGAIVKQDSIAGPPRLLMAGVGVNTEGLVVGKASWRNVRLGNNASWVDVSIYASAKQQELISQFNWYYLPFPSRRSFRPLVLLNHDNEEFYEYAEAKTQLNADTTWDGDWLGLEALAGPSVDSIRTLQGNGPHDAHFVSMNAELHFKSHRFEYWSQSPRSGFDFNLIGGFNSASLLSSVSAQSFSASGHYLYNINDFDPPLVVLGVRGGFSTTITGEQVGPGTGLPPNYVYYLGGSRDLRGFVLQSLPGPNGGLTAGFLDFEARLVATLPLGLEPIGFTDFGGTGLRPFSFGSPLFWSPGFGLRYPSPIGNFRTTLAHGMAEDRPGNWQFYFSFGEEF